MTISRQTIRRTVGGEIGIVRHGTTTSSSTTTALDTSSDSPFDSGDSDQLLTGAGILVDDGTTLHFRRNCTYDSSAQKLTFGTISGLTGAKQYEVHTEPLLHPLTEWPRLIDNGLALIRRIAAQPILLTGRGYYDITHWTDVEGVEQLRRLYLLGHSMLRNGDMANWPSGDAVPNNWTLSGGSLTRIDNTVNYPSAAEVEAGEVLSQDIQMGSGNRRLAASVWTLPESGGAPVLSLYALDSAGTPLYYADGTGAVGDGTTREQLTVELEIAPYVHSVQIQLAGPDGHAAVFWSPTLVQLNDGMRRRIQPFTTLDVDGTIRFYIPRVSGVGEMVLLLPYAGLGSAATHAADIATTTAPDKLIIAAVAVQVLGWLVSHPHIPDDSEYQEALQIWSDRFRKRAKEHMRKITKTQQLWEAGEQPGFWRARRSYPGRLR